MASLVKQRKAPSFPPVGSAKCGSNLSLTARSPGAFLPAIRNADFNIYC